MHKITHLLILIVAVLIVFLVLKERNYVTSIHNYQIRIDSLEVIDEAWQIRTEAYAIIRDSLERKITATDSLLRIEKRKVLIIKNKIKTIINNDWKNLSGNEKADYVEYAIGQIQSKK